MTVSAAPIGRPNAARWVIAYTCAVAGDATFFIVLTWSAAESGGPQWSGLILAAGAIPRVMLMLPGGVLADRVNPRRLAIGSDLARCLAMLVAATLGVLLGLLPWWLFGVAAAFGVIDAIFMPAVGAMPARLVQPRDLKRLQAWRITGVRVSNIVGPTAGALLISIGAAHAFAAIAVLFAVSVALLLSVRLHPRVDADPSTADDSVRIGPAGIRTTIARLRSRRLGRLVLVTALTDIPFSGPVMVGIILLVQERHWPAAAAGGVLSAFSIGALVSGLICAIAPPRLLGKPTVLTANRSLLSGGGFGPGSGFCMDGGDRGLELERADRSARQDVLQDSDASLIIVRRQRRRSCSASGIRSPRWLVRAAVRESVRRVGMDQDDVLSLPPS